MYYKSRVTLVHAAKRCLVEILGSLWSQDMEEHEAPLLGEFNEELSCFV